MSTFDFMQQLTDLLSNEEIFPGPNNLAINVEESK
jgi:hypothetical protein